MTDRGGMSRRPALRAIEQANKRMVSDLDHLDRTHLLSQLIHQTQEGIRGSMKTKNYGAALAGIKFLLLIIIGVSVSPQRRTWGIL